MIGCIQISIRMYTLILLWLIMITMLLILSEANFDNIEVYPKNVPYCKREQLMENFHLQVWGQVIQIRVFISFIDKLNEHPVVITQLFILNILSLCVDFYPDEAHMLYGWPFSNCNAVYVMLKKVNIFHVNMMIKLYLFGAMNLKISFHTNTQTKNDEMTIMDSLQVIIAYLLYFRQLIVAHDRKCHKYSYVKSTTSTLLRYKIFIYNY